MGTSTLHRSLRPVDVLVIAFLLVLSLIDIVFFRRISDAPMLIGVNVLSSIALIAVSSSSESGTSSLVKAVHNWYPVPTIFLVFKEMYIIIQSLARPDCDPLLIAIDHALFGTHPTVWLGAHSSPAVTEILQVAYVSYYFIMLTVGIETFRDQDRSKFSYVLFLIVYGFFLSYLGYVAFPAIGPRFTLHDFSQLNNELPGVWLTNGLRDIINAGESIPPNVSNAALYAQRDAFPSGHTEMTLISLYLAFHYRLKSRWVLLVFGSLLIISTVYLRYHYIIDVVGGILFMLFAVWSAPILFHWWERKRS
ncbi:MAG TPA: phosphatase PAP2 family protein [Bacteroidota bacterium]|nr:phosphatase PAP2 family protein [Bacteroidota bacterium]